MLLATEMMVDSEAMKPQPAVPNAVQKDSVRMRRDARHHPSVAPVRV